MYNSHSFLAFEINGTLFLQHLIRQIKPHNLLERMFIIFDHNQINVYESRYCRKKRQIEVNLTEVNLHNFKIYFLIVLSQKIK